MVKTEYTAAECVSAFCKKMNEKAAQLGMVNSEFIDPVGIENTASPSDMLKCLLGAGSYERLYGIWDKDTYTVNIEGINPREHVVTSTVIAAKESHILTDKYPVAGGKTGTLFAPGAYNLAVLVDVPETGERLGCVVMHANTANHESENRFEATRQAVDAAVIKSKNPDADVSSAPLCASGAAVCRADISVTAPDWDDHLLYSKNPHEPKVPASMSKFITAMLTLDYIEDLSEKITVLEDDITPLPKVFYAGDFKAGDVITVKDALYALMLPSSNVCAYILARFVGNRILSK